MARFPITIISTFQWIRAARWRAWSEAREVPSPMLGESKPRVKPAPPRARHRLRVAAPARVPPVTSSPSASLRAVVSRFAALAVLFVARSLAPPALTKPFVSSSDHPARKSIPARSFAASSRSPTAGQCSASSPPHQGAAHQIVHPPPIPIAKPSLPCLRAQWRPVWRPRKNGAYHPAQRNAQRDSMAPYSGLPLRQL